ncbi:ABC-2 type transport system ATP-binding protein [Microbacterium resistens]|uniref:ABC-2 type transport system ATP-binding protein n=1 Tax=Microbacterium resistens TaxID=156977 RepID=A0ABU1SBL6_9MICO|nr:ATP-binding cassette domain-containing protein [Microbacterium resistens]MDR6866959.1 ABC-2 type transport system ATP-binding protein [Microbacterium resistens]
MTMRADAVEFRGFTRRFGDRTVVDSLTFSVGQGRIVGLLGPNGAGKSTAMRGLVGLLRPTAGTATIFGRTFAELRDPARIVGVHMDGLGFETGITGRRHLEILAIAAGMARERVDQLLDLVGLEGEGRKRVKNYSTGMRQRLGLASALIGDPDLLILDEPANGLDPEGIRWLRSFLRAEADAGRTILVSSHQLGELEHVVDDVAIMKRALLYFGPLDALTGSGDQTLEDGYFDLVSSVEGASR